MRTTGEAVTVRRIEYVNGSLVVSWVPAVVVCAYALIPGAFVVRREDGIEVAARPSDLR